MVSFADVIEAAEVIVGANKLKTIAKTEKTATIFLNETNRIYFII
jgi:hypothetical protein